MWQCSCRLQNKAAKQRSGCTAYERFAVLCITSYTKQSSLCLRARSYPQPRHCKTSRHLAPIAPVNPVWLSERLAPHIRLLPGDSLHREADCRPNQIQNLRLAGINLAPIGILLSVGERGIGGPGCSINALPIRTSECYQYLRFGPSNPFTPLMPRSYTQFWLGINTHANTKAH
jgi:hypothetical protein